MLCLRLYTLSFIYFINYVCAPVNSLEHIGAVPEKADRGHLTPWSWTYSQLGGAWYGGDGKQVLLTIEPSLQPHLLF